MAHDVFISHSVKDKTIADALCATLESEGIRCWIAPRDVTPGMEWGGAIIGAIKQARVMVLVFTANANASPQIRREVERAVNHDVVILPFRLENVIPDESLEYFIGNVHWLDALTPPIEAHFRSLARTIKILLTPVWTRDVPAALVAVMPTEEAVAAGPLSMPGAANPLLVERPSAETQARQETKTHKAAVEVPVLVEEQIVSGIEVSAPATGGSIAASEVLNATRGSKLPHPFFTLLLVASAVTALLTTTFLVSGLVELATGNGTPPANLRVIELPLLALSVISLAACVRSLRRMRNKR